MLGLMDDPNDSENSPHSVSRNKAKSPSRKNDV